MLDWNTPFSKSRFPAVQVISHNSPILDIIVSPSGLDRPPVYRARFKYVVSYRVFQEGMTPSSCPPIPQDRATCSFIVDNSSWKGEFQAASPFIEATFGKPFGDIFHFVIVGGDNVVEVLASAPEIDKLPNSVKLAQSEY